MQSALLRLVLFYPIFLFSLSWHEAAHAWVADKFGDDTARLMGRVSLSPFPHMDLVGTFILPVFGILTGAPVIGWGKPVPVNPYRLKGDLRRSSLWVAASGPVSNIALAIVFAGCAHIFMYLLPSLPEGSLTPGSGTAQFIGLIYALLEMGVILNLILAFFNLIPLPPLDGGTVLRGLLPHKSVESFDMLSRYSFLILIVLFVTGLLRYILIPAFLLASYLLPA
ncbi:MAG: site-2 protease family protein [Pseudomonadota bacterium]